MPNPQDQRADMEGFDVEGIRAENPLREAQKVAGRSFGEWWGSPTRRTFDSTADAAEAAWHARDAEIAALREMVGELIVAMRKRREFDGPMPGTGVADAEDEVLARAAKLSAPTEGGKRGSK